MIFLFNKIRLVQIRDEMAMGMKRASDWTLLVHFSLVNQAINHMTECQEYVPELCPEFAPKRFYVSFSVSI